MSDNCPDCAVNSGENHQNGCDVERCPECGSQFISCGCELISKPRLPWTGEWPGIKECLEFGLYVRFVAGPGWVSCSENEPGSSEDLNALFRKAKWSKELGRFVLPN